MTAHFRRVTYTRHLVTEAEVL
ncbi:protein of unknown function [Candidatus Methylomirabilis oxygeniifera]|uniref:Uncharacterized protein n=1 Tax=Methylomirabilis oxygeniifera TaxID=671143 RepID=D5MLQ5_METO1|nr:protein of unknown function [Candidatus Methylomirabilis oxyfera]